MPYKISGNLGDDAKVIVVKESDWSVDTTSDEVAGNYEISVSSGEKLITARKSSGHSVSYGNISPIYVPADAIFAGGSTTSPINNISIVTISTTGDAEDFGDLTVTRHGPSGTSNGANNRAIFCAGVDGSTYYNIIDYISINSLGDAEDFGDYTSDVYGMFALSNGVNDKGIVAGGYKGGSPINQPISKINISSLGNAESFGGWGGTSKAFGCGLSNDTNNRGIFVSGTQDGSWWLGQIEYITISSDGNSSSFGSLAQVMYNMAGTSNGINNRAIIFGGANISGSWNTIEYFNITSLGNASSFGSAIEAHTGCAATSNKTNQRAICTIGNGSAVSNVIQYCTINSLGDASEFGDLPDATHTMAAASNA